MPGKFLSAGELRHRIAIQTYTDATDANGEQVRTWSEFAKRWASIKANRGIETLEGGKTQAITSYTIFIRYLAGLKEDMRISYGSRTFQILSIAEDVTDDKSMSIICEELKSGVGQ